MTRQWMIPPEFMCRQHLLGEHKEIHQLIGTLKKGYNIQGYIKNNCIEITSIKKRHDELVDEMKNRGYNHKSPIDYTQQEIIDNFTKHLTNEQILYKIDIDSSFDDLMCRCKDCRKNIEK